MDDIPFTRNRTSVEREEAIRAAVRSVDVLPSSAVSMRIATKSDAPKLLAFLADPEVNRWIYSLPRPLMIGSVEALIENNVAAHACGEGLLSLNFDEAGEISGYSELRVWPQWAAGEVAGAMRQDMQNKGQGGAGMARTFTWMFETLDLDLLCNTTALDNIRIQKLFQKTGFEYKGDIESVRPDGSTRASQVWEISREVWMAGQAR